MSRCPQLPQPADAVADVGRQKMPSNQTPRRRLAAAVLLLIGTCAAEAEVVTVANVVVSGPAVAAGRARLLLFLPQSSPWEDVQLF